MKKDAWLLGLAMLLGALIGVRDVRATGDDAPQLALMLLIAVGGLLGLAQPARPWRWAVALGIGPAAVHLILRAAGLDAHFHPDNYAARLLLLPVTVIAAGAGAYVGAFLRRLFVKSGDGWA